jgi:hypothetical protein
MNFKSLLAGPFLDLVFCLLMGVLNCHVTYWKTQLEYYELEAKYYGALI